MAERYDIVFLDEPLADEKDFCLPSGDGAQEGEAFLVAAQAGEKGCRQRCCNNRRKQHGKKGYEPCLRLGKEVRREGSADENGEPRNHDEVERTREDKNLPCRCRQAYENLRENLRLNSRHDPREDPQSEQAAEQKGSRNVDLLKQLSCAKGTEQRRQGEQRSPKMFLEMA